jgi:hypothetical protein
MFCFSSLPSSKEDGNQTPLTLDTDLHAGQILFSLKFPAYDQRRALLSDLTLIQTTETHLR